jgi:anaerobic selenocysteine-containing dehydrogenase
VFLIGINPAHSVPPLWKSILDGKKMGVKLMVADPRLTESAGLADLWLQLRPGTDTALLMGMISIIIQEELYDREFVTKWCYGFDKLVERAREYPPERVSEITWLSTEKIREAARLFATNKPAMVVHGMGMEHLENGIEGIQARFILGAITGNVDVQGSDYMPGPSRARPLAEITAERLLTKEQKDKQIGSDRFKLLAWPGRDLMQKYVMRVWGQECGISPPMSLAHAPVVYRAMLTGRPYPVRAAVTANSNPLVTQANIKLIYKALKSLDFYVVLDFWRTPSAEIADYILPIASWLERPWLMDNAGEDDEIYGGERALPATIPEEYEHKEDFEVCRELGMRLGQREYWPWKSTEEMFDYRLEPLGVTFKEFMDKGGYYFPPRRYKKYEETGFATPTGKLELYSTIFEKLGYDPLPKYEESHENPFVRPDLAREFPLILINGGRFHPMFHSEYFNLETTRKRHPFPIVQVNPQTAIKLNIADGDWVWIETVRGRIRMKCQYFRGIDPRVIHCEHGWWFPELPGEEPWLHGVWESNVNVLTDDAPEHCNKLSGAWPLKTALCRIYKCKDYM